MPPEFPYVPPHIIEEDEKRREWTPIPLRDTDDPGTPDQEIPAEKPKPEMGDDPEDEVHDEPEDNEQENIPRTSVIIGGDEKDDREWNPMKDSDDL